MTLVCEEPNPTYTQALWSNEEFIYYQMRPNKILNRTVSVNCKQCAIVNSYHKSRGPEPSVALQVVRDRWRHNHSLLTKMLLSKRNLPSCLNGFVVIFSQPSILSKCLLVTLAVTHEEGDIQVEQFMKWTEWSQVWSLAAGSENYNTRATAHEKPDPLSIPMTSLCGTSLLPGAREHNLISNNGNPELPLWQRPQ